MNEREEVNSLYGASLSELISLTKVMSSCGEMEEPQKEIFKKIEEKPLAIRRIISREELERVRRMPNERKNNVIGYESLDVIAPAPRSLTLEVNGACNLSCIMCPRHGKEKSKLKERNQMVMPLELFQRYVDEAFPFGDYKTIPTFENSAVVLYIQNEPFLDKQLQLKTSYVGKKKLGCVISSNLSVDIGALEFLADENSGVSKLICSVNAVTEETYNKIQKGGSFRRVRENLEYLARNKPKNLEILAQMLVLSVNEHEIDEFVKYVEGLGLKVQLKSLNRYSQTIPAEMLPSVSKISRYSGNQDWLNLDICSRLWRGPTIDVFGRQAMCCTSGYQNEGIIQTIGDKNVQEYWNSEKMQRLRYGMLLRGLEFNPYCKECDSVMSFSNNWKGAGLGHT